MSDALLYAAFWFYNYHPFHSLGRLAAHAEAASRLLSARIFRHTLRGIERLRQLELRLRSGGHQEKAERPTADVGGSLQYGNLMPHPEWYVDRVQDIRHALLSGALVRIIAPFEGAAATHVAQSLEALPASFWNLHTGEVNGFQYRHHNLYVRDALLEGYCAHYVDACRWFRSHGAAWFEKLTGFKGRVAVSASWYQPGDHSTPHSVPSLRRTANATVPCDRD